MAADHLIILGRDADDWRHRLAPFVGQVEVTTADNAQPLYRIDVVSVVLVLVTSADALAWSDVQEWRLATPTMRRAPLFLISAQPAGADLFFPADDWPTWGPQLMQAADAARIRAALNHFDALGGAEFVAEMVDLLIAQSQRQFDEIDDAVTRKAAAVAHRIGHTLKSSFGNFGARRCQRLAAAIDAAGRADRLGDVAQLLPQLRGEFEALRQILESERPTAPDVIVHSPATPA